MTNAQEKLSLLFVDDEPHILAALKRILRKYHENWDMFFTQSGAEALKIMESTPIDIIISDMMMPQMDGAALLKTVSEKYPKMVRIILSGYSDKNFIMKALPYTHQFLTKPCDSKNLVQCLENLAIIILKNKKTGDKNTNLDYRNL